VNERVDRLKKSLHKYQPGSLEWIASFKTSFKLNHKTSLPELNQTSERNRSGGADSGLLNDVSFRCVNITQRQMIGSGCETWSLAIREEHRLGVFENSDESTLS
jgi:hypothetical protein